MSETIPLEKQRERQAVQKVQAVLTAARELIANGMLVAVGYRVLVKFVEVTKGMEAVEQDKFKTLAEGGFEVKTDKRREQEERGADIGIVMSIGGCAFERHGGQKVWCDVGDVVAVNPYSGRRAEFPPKSGTFYQFVNDEDILGRIK